jgi:hypothetical protein
MIEEVIYISAFNIKPDGTIEVRKTTDVTKDGAVIASSYWRTVLQVNDPSADEVLGVDGYYRTWLTMLGRWYLHPLLNPHKPNDYDTILLELPSSRCLPFV